MATLTYTLPTRAYNFDGVSDGSLFWNDPLNATGATANPARSSVFIAGMDSAIVRRVHLVKAGVVLESVNKAADEVIGALAFQSYGGTADLWSTTITPADINDRDFGIAVAYGTNISGVKTTQTQYLVLGGYNFDFPSDAVINGIQARLYHAVEAAGGGTGEARLYYVQIQVTYTWAPTVKAKGKSGGGVYIVGQVNPPDLKKDLRHRVYDHSTGALVNEWNDVATEISWTEQINNPLANASLTMARSDDTKLPIVDTLVDEDGVTDLVYEDDDAILLDLAAGVGLGEGSDLDLNLDYKLTAYYGTFEEELLENNEPLLLENDEVMLLESPGPSGIPMFDGYISSWEADWGESDDVKVNILSQSTELNNIPLMTADIASVVSDTASGSIGLSGAGPSDYNQHGQTFTLGSTKKISRLTLKGRRWGGLNNTEYPILTVQLYNGTPTSLGSLIDTTSVDVSSITDATINAVFNTPLTLVAGTYCFILSSDQSKTGGNVIYPITLQTGATYASGAEYYRVGKFGAWTVNTGVDLIFTLWESGGNTTVPMNSMDPTNMFRNIIDYAQTQGAKISYELEDMPPTYTTVSYTFKGNTIKEALDKALELLPADWGYRYDFGTNRLSIFPRPTVPAHTATLGNNIVKMKLKRSIEKIINDVFFSGGQVSPDVNLFIRVTDPGSISQWRRGLAKLSDNRVIIDATARLLSQVAIDRGNGPQYSGSLTLGNTDFPVEEVKVGELIGNSGFGNFVDDLALQLMSRTYNVDTISGNLETIPAKVAKRIEDIKRNLDQQEQENNPVSPS